jgi:hypothetical protein
LDQSKLWRQPLKAMPVVFQISYWELHRLRSCWCFQCWRLVAQIWSQGMGGVQDFL